MATVPDTPAERVAAQPRSASRGFAALVVALVVGLIGVTLLAVSIGAVAVPVSHSWRIIAHHVLPGIMAPDGTAVEDQIIWKFRLPRALLAILVGSGLAVVGAVLQALVRNPLADPFLLGVSSGASLGAVVVLVLGSAALGGVSLSVAAFLGALLALALVYLLAQRSGRLTAAQLLLAGVSLAYLFQALYSFILEKAQSGRAAESVLFWLLGSLGGARWDMLALPAGALAIGLALLMAQYRPLNALLAGEETAISLGVAVHRFRAQLFVLTSLLVGVLVAVSGAVAFVGLILPHMARLVVGSDHRKLLPVTALGGAVFLQLVDLAARTLIGPPSSR